MAAKSKLTPKRWQEVKNVWERDPRKGYAWIIREMSLPISATAVRKVAIKKNWTKNDDGNHQKKIETITATLETKEKNKGGRPTLYKEEYVEQVGRLCLLGLIDKEIAAVFGVSESTLNTWKLQFPEFSESIKNSKEIPDSIVLESLYKSAIGSHYIEEDRVVSDGQGGQEVVTIRKQVPPDITAQIFWLKNRQSKGWRDKVEVKEEVVIKIVPWDELRAITKEALALADSEHNKIIEGRAERLGIKVEYNSDDI